jgi:hypothetical protein
MPASFRGIAGAQIIAQVRAILPQGKNRALTTGVQAPQKKIWPPLPWNHPKSYGATIKQHFGLNRRALLRPLNKPRNCNPIRWLISRGFLPTDTLCTLRDGAAALENAKWSLGWECFSYWQVAIHFLSGWCILALGWVSNSNCRQLKLQANNFPLKKPYTGPY